jgi:hypothetical protein
MWNVKCTIIRVIIGAVGIVTRSLRKNLEAVPGKHSTDSLQKTAILVISHIIRKVLQCETGSLSGGNHRWFKRSKGKSVPLQAWSGPEGSRKLRFPDFMTTAQDGGKVVSLTPQEIHLVLISVRG